MGPIGERTYWSLAVIVSIAINRAALRRFAAKVAAVSTSDGDNPKVSSARRDYGAFARIKHAL